MEIEELEFNNIVTKEKYEAIINKKGKIKTIEECLWFTDNWSYLELDEDTLNEYISDELKDDKDFMLEVLAEENGFLLKYASDRLKNDKEIVLQAIFDRTNHFELIEYSNQLKKDKEFLKEIAELDGEALYYENWKFLRDDKKIVLKAVESVPDVAQCISDRLKDDEEVMFIAAIYGKLGYASKRLKNNEKFIMKIFNYLDELNREMEEVGYYDDEGLYYTMVNMGDKLKSNYKFMLSLIEKYGGYLSVLEFVNKDIENYQTLEKLAKEKEKSLEIIDEDLPFK